MKKNPNKKVCNQNLKGKAAASANVKCGMSLLWCHTELATCGITSTVAVLIHWMRDHGYYGTHTFHEGDILVRNRKMWQNIQAIQQHLY
jgi:hypothetical protein